MAQTPICAVLKRPEAGQADDGGEPIAGERVEDLAASFQSKAPVYTPSAKLIRAPLPHTCLQNVLTSLERKGDELRQKGERKGFHSTCLKTSFPMNFDTVQMIFLHITPLLTNQPVCFRKPRALHECFASQKL